MKRVVLKIVGWSWTCGDGCCSDSGTDVTAEVQWRDCPQEKIWELWSFSYYDGAELPAYVAGELLRWLLYGNDFAPEQIQDEDNRRRKEAVFAAAGRRYDGPDWAWWKHVPDIGGDKLIAMVKDFGFDLEIQYDTEER